jgi:transposase
MLVSEEFTMSKKTVRYTPEFKQQMVSLLHSGRTAASLSKEFGPTAWSISLWDKQAGRDGDKGDGGLTSAEREELNRLRRENRKLKEEREILSKAAAWFATENVPSKRSSGSSK